MGRRINSKIAIGKLLKASYFESVKIDGFAEFIKIIFG